jgi:adenylate cyclase
MAADEHGTVARLDRARGVFRKHIEANQGRVVDTAGDSVLAVFELASSALSAALAVQQELTSSDKETPDARRMRFRIGIHIGEVLEKADGTIYGDGVNIAARLQNLAAPSGITVSEAVRGAVRGGGVARFEDQGEHTVKNIAEPIHAFRAQPREAARADAVKPARGDGAKPTVMLIPFGAGAEGKDARALAAAASDEVAAALARLTGLAVVTAADSADYIVKGRIQRSAGRTRATVQLEDRRVAKQFWSERFETELGDSLAALDDLALRISNAVRYEIHGHEAEMAASQAAEALSDEQRLGQAGHILLGSKRGDWERSRRLIDPVVARNPENFMALAIRAVNGFIEPVCGWREPAPEDTATALQLAQRALKVNERSDFAHIVLGTVRLLCERDTAAARRQAKRSLELNPNYPLAMDLLGAAMIFSGEAAAGRTHCERAARINPRFPANGWFMQDVALGHFVLGEYDAALEWARLADERERDVPRCLLILATAAWHAGGPDVARAAMARLRGLHPEINRRELRRWPFDDPADWERFRSGLDASGLPE